MFNLLLTLITGLVIGWNLHSFFMQLNPANILEISPKEISPKIIHKVQENIKDIKTIEIVEVKNKNKIIQKKTPINENFYTLLENNHFYDAMTFYIDAEETILSLYRTALLKYFEKKIKIDPQVAVEQMLELQELEPRDSSIDEEKLQHIEYGANYEEQAIVLLELMKQKIDTKQQEYQYKIPLQKLGEHFTIEVEVDSQALTLLLDTGATLTLVNENKLPSSLSIIKENIVLSTAGGKINAKLQEATLFSIADIQLEKFQIVSSSFEQKNADGLLGMNFFKKFKFKIDQEKAILYLSKK
jgi:clan AA aspartic protease (TIGR02281 family)